MTNSSSANCPESVDLVELRGFWPIRAQRGAAIPEARWAGSAVGEGKSHLSIKVTWAQQEQGRRCARTHTHTHTHTHTKARRCTNEWALTHTHTHTHIVTQIQSFLVAAVNLPNKCHGKSTQISLALPLPLSLCNNIQCANLFSRTWTHFVSHFS